MSHCIACEATDLVTLPALKNGHAFKHCPRCDLIQVDPMPSDEALATFYENYHKTGQYQSKIQSKVRRARRRIRLANGFRSRGSFLDVGCNVGFAVEAARQLGFAATGIDVDGIAIQQAKAQFPEAAFAPLSIEALADERQQFDFIYCSEVIEHLPSLETFLPALRRVMHARTTLLITTPDTRHRSLSRDFHKLVEWDSFRPPEHLLYFSKQSLNALLNRHGFGEPRYSFSTKPTLKVIVKKGRPSSSE